MSKKTYLIILLLVILCLLFILTTTAFFIYSKTANNIITFGNIKMQLLQTTLDQNGLEKNVNNNENFNITHSSTVSRRIKVKNIGKHDIFLRISLKMTGINEYNQEFDADDLVKYSLNTEDWINKEGWYYYKKIIKQEEVTSNLITEISFDINNITTNYSKGNFRFDVEAQTVQAENNADNILDVVGWPAK